MTEKNKLEEDFIRFNLNIERAVVSEMNRLHDEINALKEKANKLSEELLSLLSDEPKRN